MLRRSNTVLNRASGREMEHPLILRKRKQLEQKPSWWTMSIKYIYSHEVCLTLRQGRSHW
jgi:hypothetical protein